MSMRLSSVNSDTKNFKTVNQNKATFGMGLQKVIRIWLGCESFELLLGKECLSPISIQHIYYEEKNVTSGFTTIS